MHIFQVFNEHGPITPNSSSKGYITLYNCSRYYIYCVIDGYFTYILSKRQISCAHFWNKLWTLIGSVQFCDNIGYYSELNCKVRTVPSNRFVGKVLNHTHLRVLQA